MATRPEVPGGDGGVAPADRGPAPGAAIPVSAVAARPDPRRGARSGPPGRQRRRRGLATAILALGLVGVVVAGAGIVTQVLPRQFSARQQRRLQAWEIGKRWHEWPAGRIFPATVRYRDGGGGRAGARRLGIAGKATCAAAADAAVVRVLAQHGCVAVLRATYTDATDALAVTVGVVVLPRASAASASFRALTGQGMRADAGVRAVPFAPLAGGFRDPQRQAFSAINLAGPYLVLSASGYADGRPQVHGVTDAYAVGEMQSLADGVARSIASRLGATPPPLRCPGAPGC